MQRTLTTEQKCFEYQNTPYYQSLMENLVLPPWVCYARLSHRMWEPSNHIALPSCDTRPHNLYSRCLYITECYIWVSKVAHLHYLGPPFPTISMSQLLRTEVSPHPYPKTHWIFWLKTSTISFRGGKQNKTQNLLYDSRSVFLLPNLPEAMTPLEHSLLILINLTSFFDQHCFSILASLTASSPPAPTTKPSAKQGLCTHTWVTHEWEFQERVERVP